MVPLDRALVSSYRLSIVTMSLTAAVWPQFVTKELTGNIILGQLWTQVASVHHEYGRLTLATAGLLLKPGVTRESRVTPWLRENSVLSPLTPG